MRGSDHSPHLCVKFLFLVLCPVIRFLLLVLVLLLLAFLCHPHTTCHTQIFHTLNKNWIIVVIRWELNPITCAWTRERKREREREREIYIYIYRGYGGHQLRLKCAQVHHQSPAGTFTRVPGRCLRWSPTPPGPRWSPAVIKKYNIYRGEPVAKLYVYSDVSHTHTHTLDKNGSLKWSVRNWIL